MNKKETAKKHLKITLKTWQNADKNHFDANLAKATGEKWVRYHLI